MYKVLWIDDQHKDPQMVQFSIEADNEGFILEGYPSFEEGFEALEKNLEQFDLILLDGLFFERKGQVSGTEDESGIGMAIAKINELKTRKVFPWFVLSGKDKFTKGENPLLKANKAKCFDKTNPADIGKLFKAMRDAAKDQPDTELKYKYRRLLEVCSEDLLGGNHFSRLFKLIKHIENIEEIANTEDKLNPIRKIIERMFERLGQKGIIPEAILNNKGWINGSSRFLSNKHNEYEHLSEFIHPVIGESFYRLLSITHDASHGAGDLNLKVDEYLKDAQSDYLYRSCVYLLFDCLIWFTEYMTNNPDSSVNKSRWESKLNRGDWIKGTVVLINEKGWGTFKPEHRMSSINIPPHMVEDYELTEKAEIKITTKLDPKGTKTHIDQISKDV